MTHKESKASRSLGGMHAKANQPMTMKRYEGSAADKAKDRKMAKKKGVPVKKWEGSKEDERMDRAAVRKANRKSR